MFMGFHGDFSEILMGKSSINGSVQWENPRWRFSNGISWDLSNKWWGCSVHGMTEGAGTAQGVVEAKL
jgi:hypothetical protein